MNHREFMAQLETMREEVLAEREEASTTGPAEDIGAWARKISSVIAERMESIPEELRISALEDDWEALVRLMDQTADMLQQHANGVTMGMIAGLDEENGRLLYRERLAEGRITKMWRRAG